MSLMAHTRHKTVVMEMRMLFPPNPLPVQSFLVVKYQVCNTYDKGKKSREDKGVLLVWHKTIESPIDTQALIQLAVTPAY